MCSEKKVDGIKRPELVTYTRTSSLAGVKEEARMVTVEAQREDGELVIYTRSFNSVLCVMFIRYYIQNATKAQDELRKFSQ